MTLLAIEACHRFFGHFYAALPDVTEANDMQMIHLPHNDESGLFGQESMTMKFWTINCIKLDLVIKNPHQSIAIRFAMLYLISEFFKTH